MCGCYVCVNVFNVYLCHSNGHGGFSDSVHWGADDWHTQLDISSNKRAQINLLPQCVLRCRRVLCVCVYLVGCKVDKAGKHDHIVVGVADALAK